MKLIILKQYVVDKDTREKNANKPNAEAAHTMQAGRPRSQTPGPYFFPDVNVAPLAQAAMVFQFASFLLANCRPPEWNASPPASGASGWIRILLFSGSSAACTSFTTV